MNRPKAASRDVRPVLRTSAGVAAFLLACVTTVLVAGSSDAAVECSFLQFQTRGHNSLSRLARIELPSGRSTDLGRLDYQINAAGYSKDQDLVYGIATHDKNGWLRRQPVLVAVDRRGAVTDLGPVRVGVGGVADPTAGAVAGSRLYLRDGHRLYTLDIGPRSTTYKKLVKVVHLVPLLPALSVDDFAMDSSSGLLYGLSTQGLTTRVVSMNPLTGKVKVGASVRGLSGHDSYSSVVMSGGVMYAVRTGYGSRSQLYRITLDGSSKELATLPALTASDAAGCLYDPPPPAPPPPTPTPPRPTPTPTLKPSTPKPTPTVKTTPTPTPRPSARPTPTRTPSPTPTPTPTRTPTPAPVLELPPPPPPPPPTPTPTPVPRPAPIPAAPTEFKIAPQTAATPIPMDNTVQVLRRWSLATLLLVLTGGAAMAAQRRMHR